MVRDKLSVIIPARNEQWLGRIVTDILEKAYGDIEVIAVFDGYVPTDFPLDNNRVITIVHQRAHGMRPSVNEAAALAHGEFLMKCDAHCMFAEGFDVELKSECDGDWLVVPRRYGLDPERWVRDDSARDAHYLTFPYYYRDKRPALRGETWKQRARERAHVLIDDEMTSQGSCWMMHTEYFHRFGGVDAEHYGPFVHEFQELGNRTWLSGGRVVVNKRTWYAHW